MSSSNNNNNKSAKNNEEPALAPEPDRVLVVGQPNLDECDNKVISARYTVWSFLPKAIVEQFRRFANLYFLVIGFIMAIGYYTHAFESAISPWTTLGPLALVISFSLLVEGSADFKRHKNDAENNHADCTVLIRADELELLEHKSRDTRIMGGKDTVVNVNKAYATSTPGSPPPQPGVKVENVKIAYQKLRRMDIRQGHYVLVKNREMVPADLVLLASSNDHGSAYIETSSIDGETNLKLRNSPQLPKKVVQHLREAELGSIPEKEEQDDASVHVMESIQAATKRLARISYLGHPHGRSALEHPMYNDWNAARKKQLAAFPVKRKKKAEPPPPPPPSRTKQPEAPYIAALTTEAPNANVHVFQGRLSLPPVGHDDETIDIPLDADNVLLRGAVIRNTEWVIGVSMYTGKDTRLVRNSFETRSKFSQLDQLMNWCVVAILCLMILFITYLASMATYTNNQSFDQLWYIGWNKQTQEPWPYLPGLGTPKWRTKTSNWVQYFCMYITLLSNFIPLSMYVTVELITFMMLWFVQADKDMYDDTTNTRSIARSTIITDLGRIQYIFSDKTGTLTQNVMRFKRCSVDGMVFGAPIPKSRPTDNEPESEPTPFYPLRQLLVGQFRTPKALGLENLGGTASSDPGGPQSSSNMLTFNAEMFLRVLSLCHTVVVEKDIDKKEHIDSGLSVSSSSSKRSKASKSFFGRKRSDTGDSGFGQLSIVSEDQPMIDDSEADNRGRTASVTSLAPGQTLESMKSVDGAPYGYAYQAESPDEGALVSAASNVYGFQVVSRDSTGIRMKCTSPSHLQNSRVVKGLQSESLSLKKLAAETAAEVDDSGEQADQGVMDAVLTREPREEVWAILAVNKFDSDRKRMSILLRAPAELGGLAILFCKGADSAMLEPGVASSNNIIGSDGNTITRSSMRKITERNDTSEDELVAGGEEWDMAQILGLQAHLGDFGTEGLRTLVLGMKVLTEDECARWLEQYKAAATAMTNRSELLTKAAIEIERDLHVVGATAIEDKLQKNVPNTIATLAKAGIKLWVLTGDKRETAVEIGYSTHVLTDKMHISEVPDTGKKQVSAMIASEFIRLVKRGKLADFQNAALDGNTAPTMKTRAAYLFAVIAKCLRLLSILFSQFILLFLKIFGCKSRATKREALIFTLKEAEMTRLSDVDMRRRVRHHAEKIIKEWIATEGVGSSARNGQEVSDDESLASEDRPEVFVRADSARSVLKNLKETGRLPSSQLREVALQALTVKEAGPNDDFTIPEDALSVESFMPGNKKTSDFDKRKRTMLERLFAIDRDVRKGLLKKHMKTQALQAMIEESRQTSNQPDKDVDKKPRAIVIEGAALKHLLDPKEPELSQMLFAVASNCDAVIACRASPKQKAELLNLVRHNIKPEPITLAIGDGANDVGMIQEAHVGVGISGKEGKQAVNASDFAIPQFRFLEDLILVHGRWDFFRLSTVVLFSFYKNAIMAGILICYAPRALYSGTPLFDEWLIAMLNFVAGIPILLLGLFDRFLDKEYVKNNPEVYKASRNNELITVRTLFRWIVLVLIHIFTLYYFTVPQQSYGGGMTSSFSGLMARSDEAMTPGDGEGGDLKSVGTVTYSCLIILLSYKVLYESRSIIHGKWPAFTCKKGGEGFFSRVAYTWWGVAAGSLGFYLFAITVYAQLGRLGPSQFSQFTQVTTHFLTDRSIAYLLLIFVPLTCIAIDVCGKAFSNIFYPTQTQIHLELEQEQKSIEKKRRLLRPSSFRRSREAESTMEEP